MTSLHDLCAAFGGPLGVSVPNCLAYSPTDRSQPFNFMALTAAMAPIGLPASNRSRTSKQICQPAAPHEMTRRSIPCQSVKRAAAHGLEFPWMPPYSSSLGASARVTLVSNGCGLPSQVILTAPTVLRLLLPHFGNPNCHAQGLLPPSHYGMMTALRPCCS